MSELVSELLIECARQCVRSWVHYPRVIFPARATPCLQAGADDGKPQMDPKIVDTFTRVAGVLKKYVGGGPPPWC